MKVKFLHWKLDDEHLKYKDNDMIIYHVPMDNNTMKFAKKPSKQTNVINQ